VVSALDILPTSLAASGIPLPADKAFDGVDLLPFLNGSRTGDPHAALFWQSYFLDEKATGQAAVRQGRWKLHQHASVRSGPTLSNWALYDLSSDPGEARNLAAVYPDIVQQLDATWRSWKAQMQDLPAASTN
jgi:arylsulfatase A-like enzyme